MAKIVSFAQVEQIEMTLRDGRVMVIHDVEGMQPSVEVWNRAETEAEVWHFDDECDPLSAYPLG